MHRHCIWIVVAILQIDWPLFVVDVLVLRVGTLS